MKHIPIVIALLGSLLLPAISSAENPSPADERPVTGIQQKRNIKVVFQVTSAEMAGDVLRGLHAVNQVYDGYLAEGVPAEEIFMHVVIHGAAADHTLTDIAWNKYKGGTTGNPSRALIETLVSKNVKVELCDSRRVQNAWAKSEIHPAVALVSNAFHRYADLQFQGYAYIRQ